MHEHPPSQLRLSACAYLGCARICFPSWCYSYNLEPCKAVVFRGACGLVCTCAGPCHSDHETGGRKSGAHSSSGQAPSPPLLPTRYHATLRDGRPIRTNCPHRPQTDHPGQRSSTDVWERKTSGFVGYERRATAWVTDCHYAELGV